MTRFAVSLVVLAASGGRLFGDNVTLPDLGTDEGLLARLFIAESVNPGFKDYDADQAKRGMRAMKAAVDNRLKNQPEQFGAPKATTYADVVGAAGQFHGFSKTAAGKIEVAADVQKRIDAVLKQANTGKPGRYAAFAQAAIDIAKGPVDDPFKDVKKVGEIETTGGSFGWRKAGSTGPGGRFVAVPAAQGGVIAGNQFYTLKK